MKLALAFLFLVTAALQAETIKVASLHPLLTDVARQVGGDRVTVFDLLKPGSEAHHFEPSQRDIAAMKNAKLILASGKGLEPYLEALRQSVGGIPVVEVGRTLSSIKIEPGNEIFMDCPHHAAGGIDPHWWHSSENMERAARVVRDALTEADPAGKDVYKANAAAAQQKFSALRSWAKQQLSVIPRSDRKLVTAHAAFSYFCKEFGFKSIPVLGIGGEDEGSTKYITQTIQTIRDNKIRAAFPEDQANPKVLREIVRETGVKMGDPLAADGTAANTNTFETMLRHNVEAIVKALKP